MHERTDQAREHVELILKAHSCFANVFLIHNLSEPLKQNSSSM